MSEIKNELTVQSLGDAVKERVRKAMFDSIPDDVIGQLIAKEFEIYFQDTKNRYDSKTEPSPFTKMLKEEIQKQFKERALEVIKKKIQEVTIDWSNHGSELVGSLVQEMAPYAMQGMSKFIANDCVNQLRKNLGQGY